MSTSKAVSSTGPLRVPKQGSFSLPVLSWKSTAKRSVLSPRWCWASEEAGFLLDAERVLAGVVTRTNEEVRALLSDEQVEAFQKVLDDWAMNLDVKSYDADYDVAVILDRELYEAVRRGTS